MSSRRRLWALFLAMAMLVGLTTAASASPPEGAHESYIVVLQPGTQRVPKVAAAMLQAHSGQVGFVYEHALQGFSMTMSPQAAAALARNPRVAYIETNDTVTIAQSTTGQSTPTGITRILTDTTAVDIDSNDDYRVDVDVAVIDTGVDFEHPDLNVAGGVTCSQPNKGPRRLRTASCSPGGDDDHYHGTHVAGTIGALDNNFGVVGVAPGARIWAVKVLDSNGSGSEAMVVAGIDWVTGMAGTIEVANMSLGGSGDSRAEYDAIQGAVNAGVAFAVAAGNNGADADGYSPARFDNVLTVSALADFDGQAGGSADPSGTHCRVDQDDTLADFSNWGSAVDLAAPGVCIESTYPIERGSYGTISGTSMASPHAAGALALLASNTLPARDAAAVDALYATVISAGNDGWTDESGDGTTEPLLDVSNVDIFAPTLIPTVSTDAAPTVTIISPSEDAVFESGVSISFEASATDLVDGDLSGDIVWSSSSFAITTGSSFSRVLPAGSHTINATVTDSAGNTDSDSVIITVQPLSTGRLVLTVNDYKVKGIQWAELTWTGATGNTDLTRDGKYVATFNSTSGSFDDTTELKGGGTATYKLCETDSETCEEVTATW
ncbi:MAG: S8 family serine peptidase [Acidimicrobiaceae bacterium]|nr:S8 family serine peptidase [Acidimicrobiaceae bacterium]MBT6443677.1 S8 family serine peptidase [Acidimicrobiaceae bacterium]